MSKSTTGPMFGHRHYEAVANVIYRTRGCAPLVIALIQMFRKDNPSFDEERFVAAMHGVSNRDAVRSNSIADRAMVLARRGQLGALEGTKRSKR